MCDAERLRHRHGHRKAARLEINTSVPYMIRATYLVLASRVYAVKRFLACPFTFH